MTILQELNALGERLEAEEVLPPLGFSSEKIAYAISLNKDGSVAAVLDLRDIRGKRPFRDR